MGFIDFNDMTPSSKVLFGGWVISIAFLVVVTCAWLWFNAPYFYYKFLERFQTRWRKRVACVRNFFGRIEELLAGNIAPSRRYILIRIGDYRRVVMPSTLHLYSKFSSLTDWTLFEWVRHLFILNGVSTAGLTCDNFEYYRNGDTCYKGGTLEELLSYLADEERRRQNKKEMTYTILLHPDDELFVGPNLPDVRHIKCS